jgi:hypothetical protein
MSFANTKEILFQHANIYDLTSLEFYVPLIKSFPDPNFFVPLNYLTTVFPNVSFYSARATFGDHDSLELIPFSSNTDSKYFTLIIRYHPQIIDQLREYFDSELEKYEQMKFQVDSSLCPVGYSSIRNGSITIFLTSVATTLESQLSQLQTESVKTKIQISKNLIVFLQEAHEKDIFGFDLRPSSILFSLPYKDFSLAFIGFVGSSDILQSYHDSSKLIWNSNFFPPELQPVSFTQIQ